jgi:hypothetical protein
MLQIISRFSSTFLLSAFVAFAFTISAKAEVKNEVKPSAKAESRDESIKLAPKNKNSSEISDIIDSLTYPELQVVPRASERVRMEAKDEEDNWWYAHWQVELSGLMTYVTQSKLKSSLSDNISEAEKNDLQLVTTAGQAVGIGWMAAGLLIGWQKPYRSTLANLSKYNGKDERSILLRERLAEEGLERPARLMSTLKMASILSNLVLNLAVVGKVNSTALPYVGLGAAFAFLPYIFEDSSISVFEKHNEYKKKIYGPIASTSLVIDESYRQVTPVAQLTWSF